MMNGSVLTTPASLGLFQGGEERNWMLINKDPIGNRLKKYMKTLQISYAGKGNSLE